MRKTVSALGLLVWFGVFNHADAHINVETVPIKDGPPIIVLEGDFELGDDPSALVQAANVNGSKIVSFNSNGGNIVAAMAFGRTIRKLGLWTIQPRSNQCASACTLAFVGGVERMAEPGSIGVHQSSFAPGADVDGSTATTQVQLLTAELMSYFIEMGVDPKLLQLSLSTPSSDMRYLTSQEMTKYRVTTPEQGSVGETASAPSTSPAPVASASSRDLQASAPSFVITLINLAGESKDRVLAASSGIYSDTVAYFGHERSRVEVLADKGRYIDRWPIRRSNVRMPTVSTSCVSHICTVTGVYDWQVANPSRRKSMSGTALFEYQLEMNGQIKVIEEGGKVLSRSR